MKNQEHWRPSASISNLWNRGKILKKIRCFFSDRNILEVETPIMSQAAATDVYLSSFQTCFVSSDSSRNMNLWLTTSPEYHMKRLLAAGSGSIYQISRSFRNEEVGRYHNPEFTMLEWYRTDFDMYCLINEVDDFLQKILKCLPAESLSYQEVFSNYLEIDPLSANKMELYNAGKNLGIREVVNIEQDRDTLLQLLFMIGVEPNIGIKKPTFIYNFPATQAALSVISTEDNRVANRFEVYFRGIELANGFYELTNAYEQKKRFEENNRRRNNLGLPQYPIDDNLLAALEHGMPSCSGVALGIDRLMMIALNADSISEVIAFPIDRC